MFIVTFFLNVFIFIFFFDLTQQKEKTCLNGNLNERKKRVVKLKEKKIIHNLSKQSWYKKFNGFSSLIFTFINLCF